MSYPPEDAHEKIKGRDVRVGDVIGDPRGRDSRFLRIDAIVEVPEMNGRTLWFEEQGRGEYVAVRLDDDLARVVAYGRAEPDS